MNTSPSPPSVEASPLTKGSENMVVAIGGSHVLKKKSYASLTQAQGIIKQAHQQAEAIIKQAKVDGISIKDEALQKAEQQWKSTQIKRSFIWARRCVHALCLLENDVVLLIQKALMKVTGQCDQDALIRHVVKSLLAAYKDKTGVIVKVTPSQKATIRKMLASQEYIRVVEDDDITEGSCHLEGPLGIIEGGLKHTIKTLKKQSALLTANRPPPESLS